MTPKLKSLSGIKNIEERKKDKFIAQIKKNTLKIS